MRALLARQIDAKARPRPSSAENRPAIDPSEPILAVSPNFDRASDRRQRNHSTPKSNAQVRHTAREYEDRERCRTSSPTWLLLFADVAALLLAFFVMLFAMSNVQSEKWDSVVAMLSTRETAKDEIVRPTATAKLNIATVELDTALPLDYLGIVLQEKLQRDDILNRAILNLQDQQLVISLPGDALFEPGQAETTQSAREALFRIGAVLSTIGNQIDVRGHTGREQVGESPYQSNWELSLARAVAVANELRRTGYTRAITALGLADSRFEHISHGLSAERRNELAARVDLVIHPFSGDQ